MKSITHRFKNFIKPFVLSHLSFVNSQSKTFAELHQCLRKNKQRVASRAGAAFGLEIFDYVDNQISNLKALNTTKKVCVLHLCVWGKPYAERATRYLLPSLLSTNNLPACSELFALKLLIHCDADSLNVLKNSSVTAQLSNIADIEYCLIPDSLSHKLQQANSGIIIKLLGSMFGLRPQWKYYLLGVLQHLGMLYAQKNKAIISFLMPDLLFSDGAYYRMLTEINRGKTMVLATAYRSSEPMVSRMVESYYQGSALRLPAKDLTDIITTSMHISAQARIVTNQNKFFKLTPQLIFSYAQQIVIRSLHYHPLLVDFSRVSKTHGIEYYPIDKDMFERFLDLNQDLSSQVWINQDGDDISIMEISEENIESIFPYWDQLDVNSKVKEYLASNQWNDIHKFLFKNRYVYNLRSSNQYMLSEIHDTELTM